MGVKEAMLRSIKLTSRNTSVCKDLTPEFYRKQAAFPCNVTDMMSHDVLTLTRQQANPRQDSSLENLSQKLQLHVLQSPKLACLRSCMRQLHSNQLHGKRAGGRAKLLNLSILNMVNNLVAETQLPQLTRLTYKWQFHSELDICEIKPSTMPFTETNEKLSAAIFNNAHIT